MTEQESRLEPTRWELRSFTGRGYDKGRSRTWQLAWLCFDSLLFRRWWFPAAARASALRGFGADIGDDVLIRHGVKIHWPWKVTIGTGSWIGAETWILNLEHVTIGSNTCISQGVLLCTGSHDPKSPTFEFDNRPIAVGSGVWIGTRSTILRGVRVGDGSTIGACCLVVKDVPVGSTVLAPVGLAAPSS